MGAINPDLGFEMGWSLLNLRRWQEAVIELEQYEQHSPGRGQTSEFLGRAYYALGNFKLAESLLQEAVQRDPALSSTALVFLALVARARGDQEAIARHLGSLMEDNPDSPFAQRLRKQAALLAKEEGRAARPFQLTLSASGGYNDNVIALGKGVSLPSDISDEAAAFSQSTLDASYAWELAPEDTLLGGYRLLSTVYDGLSSFDLIDHFMYVDFRHDFGPNWTGTFRLSDEFTQVGGDNFRNQVALRPALLWRSMDWNFVELAYGYFNADYYFPTTSVLNRDSETHTVALTDFFRIPGWPLHGRLGYFHLWTDAGGADYDYESDGLVVGLTAYPLRELTVEAFYARIWTRYDNLNSLSGTTGFAFKRMDDVDLVTAQLTWSFFDWLEAFVRYDYTKDVSNISFFNFDQNRWSGGVVLRAF